MKIIFMPVIISPSPFRICIIHSSSPKDGIAGRNLVNILICHFLTELAVDQIKLGIPVISPQVESLETIETGIFDHGFKIRVIASIMPDCSRTRIRNESTVFCKGPATRTIKINTAFHQAVFKIEHAVIGIPWAYRVAGKGAEVTIDGS